MHISDWSSDVCSSDLTPRPWCWSGARENGRLSISIGPRIRAIPEFAASHCRHHPIRSDMLHWLPAPLLGVICALTLLINTVFWCVPVYCLILIKLITPKFGRASCRERV